MKILLARDNINPDKPDDSPQTRLSWADRKGYEGVVKVLVGRDEIHLDKPDNGGQIPLSWAAVLGQEEVVDILLRRNGFSPDKPKISGRAAFWYDSKYCRAEVITLLQSLASATPARPKAKEASPSLRPANTNNLCTIADSAITAQCTCPSKPLPHSHPRPISSRSSECHGTATALFSSLPNFNLAHILG